MATRAPADSDAAIRLRPDDAESHNGRGVACCMMHDYGALADSLRRLTAAEIARRLSTRQRPPNLGDLESAG
jgi:hypothetical protein